LVVSYGEGTVVARSVARLASYPGCKSSPNIGGLKLAPCELVICTSQPAVFRLRAFDTAACGFSRSVCTRCPVFGCVDRKRHDRLLAPPAKAITSVMREQEKVFPQCSARSSPGIARSLNNRGLWTGCGHLEASHLPPAGDAIFLGDSYRTTRSKQTAARGCISRDAKCPCAVNPAVKLLPSLLATPSPSRG
jgi:hypothetical protein